jgi:MOSC domain-containing protein YiiM
MTAPAGKLIGIYAGAKKGAGKRAIAHAELVAGYGLRGDAHAGLDEERQVSLFPAEILRELEAEGIPVSPEGLSANLITEGIALNTLSPGARLRVGEAVIEISEPRQPCGSLTKLDKRLPKRLYQRCGMLGRIITSGIVRAGETVEVLTRDERPSQAGKAPINRSISSRTG